MKAKRVLVGVALAAGVAACGDVGAPLSPAGPSFDGGHTLGGGARYSGVHVLCVAFPETFAAESRR